MDNFIKNNIDPDKLKKELEFRTTRSSGSGGQNVNKVSTKVILIFDLEKSNELKDKEKKIIKGIYNKRLTKSGQLLISVSKFNSQFQNKKTAIERFLKMMNLALEPSEIRIATKPSRSSKEKRLVSKAKKSEKKGMRNFNPGDWE